MQEVDTYGKNIIEEEVRHGDEIKMREELQRKIVMREG